MLPEIKDNILYLQLIQTILKKGKIWSMEQYNQYIEKNSPSTAVSIPVLEQTPPNPLGFYDLVTNNYEWMNDWYDKDYYKDSPIDNPTGPKTGTEKVLRSTSPMGTNNLMMADG